MPSSEKIISPGVFTTEIDKSFLPAAIADIGAAVIGPTVKGPALVPTVVTSYSEYRQKFGDTFKSGSNYYQYLTSHTAENYLKHANKLTVVRILDGAYGPAYADVSKLGSTTGASRSTGSLKFLANPTGSLAGHADEIRIGSVHFTFVSSSVGLESTTNQMFVQIGHEAVAGGGNIVGTALNFSNAVGSSSIHGMALTASSDGTSKVFISASGDGTSGNFTITTGSRVGTTARTLDFVQGLAADNTTDLDLSKMLQSGTDSSAAGTAFRLHTLTDGTMMNNSGSAMTGSNNTLLTGSKDNVRWEIAANNTKKGTFTLLVRRGDDSIKRKQAVESWNNLTLDPNSNNYIGKRLGDQKLEFKTDSDGVAYLQQSGSYPNKSKYVRVSNILNTTDYLDENGDVRIPVASASLPDTGSGSYHGSFKGGSDGYIGYDGLGTQYSTDSDVTAYFYDEINSTNTQGYTMDTNQGGTAYDNAFKLLANADEYDINLIMLPGIMDNAATAHSTVITTAIQTCEDRGDCFVLVDPTLYGYNITDATAKAEARDTNYAAEYWPWVQIPDALTGKNRWVPPSVVMGGIYAFNDKVAHPWFAPAGLNRGGIDMAIQAERKLTHSNRDTLYDSNVNPIATFPGQGVTVWGQKTLQKKASALDRVNVRRLLIKVKKFIASASRFLVFEQNTSTTRQRFLNIANPFLEQVQSNSGLSAFRVVMDETNNTPDIVDRNILYGQIFLQPTRTAEFIVLDFTVQPTGATFPE